MNPAPHVGTAWESCGPRHYPGLVFLLVLVAALEWFGLWASDHGRLPWRRENALPAMKVDLDGDRIVLRDRLPDR